MSILLENEKKDSYKITLAEVNEAIANWSYKNKLMKFQPIRSGQRTN